MKNILDTECTVGVHNGIFHADDVSSMVLLTTLNPTIKYCRTRDVEILNSLDCVIDVGDVYDPSIQRFDHHGKDFNERYPSPNSNFAVGPKLATIGLLFRHFGRAYIEKVLFNHNKEITPRFVDYIYEYVLKNIVIPIDIMDNGENRTFKLDTSFYKVPSVTKLIANLNNAGYYPEEDKDNFEVAMRLMKLYLESEVIRHHNAISAEPKVLDLVDSCSTDMLVLEDYTPWSAVFTNNAERCAKINFVIYPSTDGEWLFQPTYYSKKIYGDKFSEFLRDGTRRRYKYHPPRIICGLVKDQLSAAMGNIEGTTFIHASGFIGGAATKEAAMKMCEYIKNNQEEDYDTKPNVQEVLSGTDIY